MGVISNHGTSYNTRRRYTPTPASTTKPRVLRPWAFSMECIMEIKFRECDTYGFSPGWWFHSDVDGWWSYQFQMVLTKNPSGDWTEWRVYNPNASDYIIYNGGRDEAPGLTHDWHFDAWYKAPRELRQEYFRRAYKMEPLKIGFEGEIMNIENTQLHSFVCCKPTECIKPPSQMNWLDQHYDYLNTPPEMLGVKQEKESAMISTSKMPTVTDLTINMAPAASASVTQKSDVQQQRDHLLSRLREVEDSYRWGDKRDELRDLFNLDANNTPTTSRELIAAIKDGKFKLDERLADLQDKGNSYDPVSDDYIGNSFGAITFDGPTPDKTGFTKALDTLFAMVADAKDTIIVKSPDEGLAAIQALKNWTPTGKAN